MVRFKQWEFFKLFSIFMLLIVGLSMPASSSSETDLHWLWHDRCADCHGHSSDFAQKYLRVRDGSLLGLHHVDNLPEFLHNHYLPGELVDEVYALLLAQLNVPPRFKNECSGCHQTAAVFARAKLDFQGDVLSTKKTGQSVANFLKRHRGLTDADILFYVELLDRVGREVKLPVN